MFGYIRTDTPYLFMKDDVLYHAMYCGVCKGIGQTCGHSARIGLSYDITFLSVILHNILGVDVKIEKQHCLTHCIRVRPMAETDDLTRQLGAFNTVLAYYKYTDDIQDGDGGKCMRALFQKGFNRAKKNYPEIVEIVKSNLSRQSQIEKVKTASLDRSADATATMLAEFCNYVLGEKATQFTYNLFYAVGKWIYWIDALDDYDKDKKKGAYNPFILSFQAESREALLKGKSGEEVRYCFNSVFYDIRENLSNITFHFNQDLSNNILLRGLPLVTHQVMEGCFRCKKKDKSPKTTNTTN